MTDTLNKNQIKELLPHREPMLLIDKLTNIGLEVEGVKVNSGELSEFKIAKILKNQEVHISLNTRQNM